LSSHLCTGEGAGQSEEEQHREAKRGLVTHSEFSLGLTVFCS
jgi:hypothetical protein